MPKYFLAKQLEEMSVLESVPYRPWCEGELQENPVDFSLKNKKKKTNYEPGEIRSQLFVRTPDSGFSSPSESEFLKRQSCHLSPGDNFQSIYSKSLLLQSEEQIAPLALVKKKNTSLGRGRSSPKPDKNDCQPEDNNNSSLYSTDKDSNLLMASQASAFKLLSHSLYWPHVSTPRTNSMALSSLVSSAYDLSLGQTELRNSKESLIPNAESAAMTHSTPIKTPPRSPEVVVASPIKRKTPTCIITPEKKTKSLKKTKTSRRLNFDEDKTSPVSGTIIRQLEEGEEPLVVRKGDIDPEYNVVEITEEAKAELSKIENKIGDYVCRLCKELYDDAFGLAQHRCSRIIHVEYRCPECDKVFNCPANLASHRRWHKPKGNISLVNNSTSKGIRNDSSDFNEISKSVENTNNNESFDNNNQTKVSSLQPPALIPLPDLSPFPSDDSSEQFECSSCYKKFKRQSYLRKHLLTHNHTLPHNHFETREPESTSLRPLMPLSSPHEQQVFSPTSPPMLSPLISPPFTENIFRCRMCSATFFTPAALHLHSSTIHGTEEHSTIFPSTLSLPIPHQYSPKAGMLSPTSLYSSYPFLHRSPQISAPS